MSYKQQANPLLSMHNYTPKTNHTCHQKPNPSREPVSLSNYVLNYRNLPPMSTVLRFTSSFYVKANTNKKCTKCISIRDDWGHRLKGHEISTSGFFHESVPEYTIRAISNFFAKFLEIFGAQGAPPMSLTPVAMEKIFDQKSCNYFFGTQLLSGVNI